MDERKKLSAADAFVQICNALDKLDWKYSQDESDLRIECSAQGEDLPMDLIIRCDVDMQLLQLFSQMPFTVPEDKRLDFAVVVSVINNKLVDGCFDYNVLDGKVFFRMTNSFRDIALGFETIKYLIFVSCATIDSYNDKFLMVSKGMISLEQFLESEA
ncbi:MAG: hypothetical protein IJ017_04155 [Oscillospiraceae bacterium]|nr:hypothetical protein [Oscillospiraceae bacterium]